MSITAAIVLAAGDGTRMKSSTPKVLHSIAGKTFLQRVMLAVTATKPQSVAVVVRNQAERVSQAALSYVSDAVIVHQDEIPGTGRAVQCAIEELKKRGELHGTVLVTAGDMPMLDGDTLTDLVRVHEDSSSVATILSCKLDNPFGYGRIIRDSAGGFVRIVEQKDGTDSELAVNEVNTSVYAFDADVLAKSIEKLNSENSQGEFYLTDALANAREIGKVGIVTVSNPLRVEGVNDRVQLAKLAKAYNQEICEHWMREGVTIMDPETTWIEDDVRIEADAVILPGSYLQGQTCIASDAVIGPDTTLINAVIERGAKVERSRVESTHIGEEANIGPWTYLRPGNELGKGTKAGAFVEMKKAIIDEGTKVPHLSYVGDAHIAHHTNIGGGTITANYDGVHKHHTEIGANVHIGAGNMFVAPVTVGDNVTTGSGSVVRHDVPADSMVYSENSQHVVENWKPAWERDAQ
ncbi:bifunctional UDP-N-acetylglucosamine diphosphorylase/glucosamine-1-phosphate N-acetyltransferase GlmU [Alloscardovia theropitheci]|uniref:Bifunctional protein GlmU n=1 Tax=Alloscardovia theropitheci TaxID=2496842 RepID=A0A4R0QVS7_9BIFI|nr:bifunctional UDP-N-acetylglucosamine diphosphorylase/glucosamine-1-phosphate N-acetyltransferase GlmU [Alloscardovia theropitheci]TCD53560.1 bifunctional UDP-N-acetylglucosamine diphosphorylase/glucosamine-1-phosphate N-acetyltransferase GlmU [Alloscardovia theropitheci]